MPDPTSLSQSPFAVLSLIGAPAILTNAASVLAMSTSNRFLRASDRMRTLAARMDAPTAQPDELKRLLVQVDRVEKQAVWLLSALRGAYVALGSFATASLVSIIGTGLFTSPATHSPALATVGAALTVGFIGVGGLVWGCLHLFRATRLSMINIQEEAEHIRERGKHHLDPG